MSVHSWLFASVTVGVGFAVWPFAEHSLGRVTVIFVLVGIANVLGYIEGRSL